MSADLRRAALTLHALAAPDRDWVMRRLAPQQQHQLQQHLGELQSLGLTADTRLVEQALQQGATAPEPQWRNALRACDAQRLHEGLRGEPAALIARLLNNSPGPWEEEFLARLDKLQRARVSECRTQDMPESRELDESLLRALAARLALPPPAAAPRRRPGSRLQARMRQVFAWMRRAR